MEFDPTKFLTSEEAIERYLEAAQRTGNQKHIAECMKHAEIALRRLTKKP